MKVRKSTAKVLTATQQELIDRINAEAAKVRTLNATVDIDTSVGGEKKGKITDFKEITGYVLVRQPEMLRMIGLFPLVRNKAFDMVSDGTEFKLSIPVTSKFYVGHNNIINPGSSPVENLRPQVIYDALLLHAIDPATEIAVMESSSENVVDAKTRQTVEEPTYVIDVIRKTDGRWYLSRKVIFDRDDLIPDTQVIYDKFGNVATEVHYRIYKDFNGTQFPTVIQINRPQEEYDIQLTIVKLTLNEPLNNDQFVLEPPPGSQIVNLDEPNASPSPSKPAGPAAGNSKPQ